MCALVIVGAIFLGLLMCFGMVFTAVGLPTEVALLFGAVAAVAFLYHGMKK